MNIPEVDNTPFPDFSGRTIKVNDGEILNDSEAYILMRDRNNKNFKAAYWWVDAIPFRGRFWWGVDTVTNHEVIYGEIPELNVNATIITVGTAEEFIFIDEKKANMYAKLKR